MGLFSKKKKRKKKKGLSVQGSPELSAIQPDVLAGLRNIGGLMRNPGSLNPNIAGAIGSRVSQESEGIARNFQNLRQEQAGAASRSNLPVSFKNALAAGTGIAESRAQRESRRAALGESEELRREDMGQATGFLDRIMGARSEAKARKDEKKARRSASRSANIGAVASLAGAFMSASASKEGFTPVDKNAILEAVNTLAVRKWNYKGEKTKHIGPVAEDFKAALKVGDSPHKIYTVDAHGSLLAAVQALSQKVTKLEKRRK